MKRTTMGHLIYGDGAFEVDVEDRALAHLQIVIGAKLRRQESFFFSWEDGAAEGGHSSIWLNPYIPLRFAFQGREPIQINREWLELLTRAANSTGGLRFVPEAAEKVDTVEAVNS
jgi:hypothetical protein